jgi:hypothetical protein
VKLSIPPTYFLTIQALTKGDILSPHNNVYNCRCYDAIYFVAEAVRRNQLTARATQAEVEREIKLWFRRVPDRYGGRNERGDN